MKLITQNKRKQVFSRSSLPTEKGEGRKLFVFFLSNDFVHTSFVLFFVSECRLSGREGEEFSLVFFFVKKRCFYLRCFKIRLFPFLFESSSLFSWPTFYLDAFCFLTNQIVDAFAALFVVVAFIL